MADKNLSRDDFEIFKKLGDGNFTKIYQVYLQKYPNTYYALKECQI